MKHAKVFRVILAALVAMTAMLLAACSSQQSSSQSTSVTPSSSATGAVSSSASSVSASTMTAGSEGVVTIGLDYNAGTGFEWKCKMEPEGVVTIVDQHTQNLATQQNVSGGPLREVYTVRAAKPGEVTLTFDLVREWEGEPAETQVYAFTVSDDLSMVLNPYKSNFNNEPEWGSNS